MERQTDAMMEFTNDSGWVDYVSRVLKEERC